MPTQFNLQRFLDIQETQYPIALSEIQSGGKQSHWIWYIFPQDKHLGRSYNSIYYGLDGVEEARAYLEHPILNARLREITNALLAHRDDRTILQLMGSAIDVMKLKSCMEIFDQVSPSDVFSEVLKTFYSVEK